MKSSKFWVAVLGAGVVVNIIDYVSQGMIMEKMYYARHQDVFSMTANPAWFVLGDFVTVFVLAWVYDKVSSSFGKGWMGGAMYGLYAGVLTNFPLWLLMTMYLRNFGKKFALFSTIYGIVWTIIAGAVLAALYKKGESTPTAS